MWAPACRRAPSALRPAPRASRKVTCRCAEAIIARPIALAMKRRGGRMLALIRPSLPARCGWRPVPCRSDGTAAADGADVFEGRWLCLERGFDLPRVCLGEAVLARRVRCAQTSATCGEWRPRGNVWRGDVQRATGPFTAGSVLAKLSTE